MSGLTNKPPLAATLAVPDAAAFQSRRRAAALWLGYLALAALVAVPLLAVEVPLGVDTLEHLARAHIQAHIKTDSDLAALYELRPGLVPYMGLDWVLAPMAQAMPTLLAGRVFIVLLLWALIGAVVVIQRVFTGRVGFEPLLMGLVSYNNLLAWGFLNYLLGVVVALLGFAAWHGLRERRRPLRLAVAAAVATALYVTHLLAFGLYGVMLCAYEVFGRTHPWRTPVRDWVVLGLQFVPGLALWSQLQAQAPEATLARWGAVEKALVLPSPFVFAGAAGGWDIGLAAAVLCGFLLPLTRTGALRWHRPLAAVALVLLVAGLVLPTRVLGVHFVDLRFPFVAACLAIAALSVPPQARLRLLPLSAVLAVLAVLQVSSATTVMRACDRQYGELRSALQVLPSGVVLTAVHEHDAAPGARCTNLLAYAHMPQLVVIERSGFSPDFFARVTPVAVRGGRVTDFDPIPAHEVTPDMLPRPGHVLWMHLGHRRPVPPGLTALVEGSFFTLYRAD